MATMVAAALEWRGFSLDMYINGHDSRGFFPPAEAIAFLRAVHQASRDVGAEWRVLYNDFGVADAINRQTESPRRAHRRPDLRQCEEDVRQRHQLARTAPSDLALPPGSSATIRRRPRCVPAVVAHFISTGRK